MKELSDISITTLNSPIGVLYLIFSGSTLAGLEFDRPDKLSSKNHRCSPDIAVPYKEELRDYLRGVIKEFKQEIVFLSGTVFEQEVWLGLRDIPYGETRSYKWLAEKVGSPGAVRAVGQALGKNPLPVILPCHRIICSDGTIGGYSPRLEIKEWLLRHEVSNQRD